jgi:hypothetical protein
MSVVFADAFYFVARPFGPSTLRDGARGPARVRRQKDPEQWTRIVIAHANKQFRKLLRQLAQGL